MSSSKRNIRYKCPYCDKRFTREDLVHHVEDEHEDMIPDGYSALRLVFNYVNKKPIDYNGKCTECGGETGFDENTGRYRRQCQNPACKASFIKKFENNMIRTKGVTRISSTAEGQEKMLANRKISGTYKFKNGKEKTYTGSYELNTLKFMDRIMDLDPDDIMCPGPVLEYEYEDKKHLYITDFYYQPYNLIIEVKDGGSRPNNRNMPEYRGKQIAKEKFIIKNTNYNYLRLTDNDLSQLLSVFADLKMQLVENTGERVIHVNEAMNALLTGYIPGMKDTGSVYVVNYMKNNVFSGETEKGYGVSDNCKLTNLITRNKSGILEKSPDDFLENATYDVYLLNKSVQEVSNLLSSFIGEFVEEGFLYETLFNKKMYTYDQIVTESSAIPCIDYYTGMELFKETVDNFLLGKIKRTDSLSLILTSESTLMSMDIDLNNKDKSVVSYASIKDGVYRVESVEYPELGLESNHKLDENSIESNFLKSLLVEVK